MDIKTRKKYYNLCNPYKTLSLASGDVFDIDNFKIDNNFINIRGENWAEKIAKKIEWAEEPQVVYFTGYPGSGKTTELKRVEAILEDRDYTNLLPVYINALEYLPKHESLDEIDIFSTIVYSTMLKVSEYLGESNHLENETYFSRLWTWLNETDVILKNAEVGKDNTKLVIEMKNNPSFRSRIKSNINAYPSRFKDEVIVELTRLNELVKEHAIDGERKSGIVIIFDSLEHNIGIGSEATNVANSIHRLFANRDNLLLPIDVIYTLPPHLSNRQIGDIEFLPVVRVRNRDNSICSDGVKVMKNLLYERIPREDMNTIFGDDESRLDSLIVYSGGYPRDLLYLVQQVILVDNYPISNADINTIFQELENKYRDNIPLKYKDELLKIYKTKEVDFSDTNQVDMAQTLFSIHVILRYRNGEQWFSLNPPSLRVLGIEE
ncbi:MAG: Unknown protein [uncultured Sulfurovum sp.]|uniref:Orc1-like AAA ATPase domain-containing protein n=1 Tax=uncultured Sulfurovum sp. TaxID=269237 RepID=A0A6S6U9N5_9BACT|nr:MAG: Unknown protein [uncultured Sulfurovum sp.]